MMSVLSTPMVISCTGLNIQMNTIPPYSRRFFVVACKYARLSAECYVPHSQVHNERTVTIIMHCACTKRPYFHFRSKIWCHHGVTRPRLPLRRQNFANSAINKGYIKYFYYECAKRPYFNASGLKSDVTITFLDHDFHDDASILAIRVHIRHCMDF